MKYYVTSAWAGNYAKTGHGMTDSFWQAVKWWIKFSVRDFFRVLKNNRIHYGNIFALGKKRTDRWGRPLKNIDYKEIQLLIDWIEYRKQPVTMHGTTLNMVLHDEMYWMLNRIIDHHDIRELIADFARLTPDPAIHEMLERSKS